MLLSILKFGKNWQILTLPNIFLLIAKNIKKYKYFCTGYATENVQNLDGLFHKICKKFASKKKKIAPAQKGDVMISIIAFIVVIFGSMNWLSIGLFQYDLVAGLFGYQGSIFSRIVYIVVGICAIYLIYVIIKNKGRLTVKKLKKEEQPLIDKITKKDEETIEKDKKIAQQVMNDSNQKTENKKSEKVKNIDSNDSKTSRSHINVDDQKK